MVLSVMPIFAIFAMTSASPPSLSAIACQSGECPIDDEKSVEMTLLQTNIQVHNPNLLKIATLEKIMTLDQDCTARVERFNQLGEQDLSTEVGKDPLFPPKGISIAKPGTTCGDTAQGISESCDKYNHWKTFQQVASSADQKFKVFGESGIQFGDIGQGELGNCYFLAALAAIANQDPQIISDMFVDRDMWENNVFKTKWLVNGKVTVVSVDNMIPAAEQLFFTQPSVTGEYWPVILAKAWAKIYGSFKGIEGGISGNVISAITRAPVTYYSHSTTTAEQIWDHLLSGTQNKFPMGAGTAGNAPNYGLASGHAYCILSAYSHDTYGKVVKMFNPWRTDHYSGAIPNTEEVNGPQSGVFTIPLTEFMDAFDSTEVAKVYSGYEATSVTIPTDKAITKQVTVDAGEFFISITWPGGRMLEPCGFADPRGTLLVAESNAITNGQGTMMAKITNYNSLSTQVGNPSGGTYEFLARALFHKKFDFIHEVQLTVYAPAGASIESSTLSSTDLALNLVGPTEESNGQTTPCKIVQIQSKPGVSFTMDETQLTGFGVPTYWSEDKQTFAYLASSTSQWLLIGADHWSEVQQGEEWSFEKVNKADMTCGASTCFDSETYISPMNDGCKDWVGFKCTGYAFSADLQTNCPKACKAC